MEELFSHESQKYPPALSKNGELRGGDKAELLSCIKEVCINDDTSPSASAAVLEGSVLVNMIKPGKEYAEKLFVPRVQREIELYERVDVVFDTYKMDSLKSTARQKRGKGIRRKVEARSQAPSNWASFVRIDENKT